MNDQQTSKETLDFWNGNRSEVRKVYERELLETILAATNEDWGTLEIKESLEEYPGNEESLVFIDKGHDLFVTIAGNQKFKAEEVIMVPHLLAKNLLGYRVPIIRKEDKALFASINAVDGLQKLKHGIPETWSDANIFRHNGYQVAEEGSFDDIFDRLQGGQFDYTSFGANEVLGVFEKRASEKETLIIEQNLLLFYPFPLVFYVNPEQPELALRIDEGMQRITSSGKLDSLFRAHFGHVTKQLKLSDRRLFILENPMVPNQFNSLSPKLENL